MQLSLFDHPILTVTELTFYLRDLIESDSSLQNIWVQGEISNLSQPKSGHLYFTLKDTRSALRCVMWRNLVQRQSFTPSDGQLIEAHGSLNIYETQGNYQLYIDSIRPIGEGVLYQEFLNIKARLEEEGLFAEELKRPIPARPECIGIVTSPTGAALQDVLNTLKRRYPLVRLLLAPTSVQGELAPAEIISALDRLNRLAKPDIILLVRGGGSIEDLWAFNNEKLARAISASPTPIITGIGHETDFTIADFVSDLRAPTPTAAAELATPDKYELIADLVDVFQRMKKAVDVQREAQSWQLNNFKTKLFLHSPKAQIRNDRQRLDDVSRRYSLAIEQILRMDRTRLNGLGKSLTALDPTAVMKRGFAVVTDQMGNRIKSIIQLLPGEHIRIDFTDGQVNALVEDATPTSE